MSSFAERLAGELSHRYCCLRDRGYSVSVDVMDWLNDEQREAIRAWNIGEPSPTVGAFITISAILDELEPIVDRKEREYKEALARDKAERGDDKIGDTILYFYGFYSDEFRRYKAGDLKGRELRDAYSYARAEMAEDAEIYRGEALYERM